jgi:hypothetical protein
VTALPAFAWMALGALLFGVLTAAWSWLRGRAQPAVILPLAVAALALGLLALPPRWAGTGGWPTGDSG